MKWTEYNYYRLLEYVTYRRGQPMKESVRCACQNISQRKPYTGLPSETLRRRFYEAARLWEQGKLGRYKPLDLNFALTQEDAAAMMPSTSLRYPNAMEEYARAARMDPTPNRSAKNVSFRQCVSMSPNARESQMAGLVERVPLQTGDPLNPQTSPAISIAEGPGRVCVYVVFATDAEADAAAEKVREALANAVSLRRP